MERLTEYDEFGNADIIGVDSEDLQLNLDFEQMNKVTNALNKLAEYEDLEEQGLLLRLPLKIGDTVYSVTRDFISEYKICSIEKYNEGFFFNWKCEKGMYINIRGFTNHQIGKDVFLTKSEAEQKLKEMESK